MMTLMCSIWQAGALLDKLKQKFDDSNAEFDQKALSDIHEDVQCAGEYFDNTIC